MRASSRRLPKNLCSRSRAIAILNALLGSWGRRGGLYSAAQLEVAPYPKPAYPQVTAQIRDRDDHAQYPLGHELAQGIRDSSMRRDGREPGVRGADPVGSGRTEVEERIFIDGLRRRHRR